MNEEIIHTKTREEKTIDNIEQLKEIINKYLQEYEKGLITKEQFDEIIIYKLLLFTLGGYEENILHRYAWDYFDKNKDYLIEQIP